MSAKFTINASDMRVIQKKISAFKGNAEKSINGFLKTKGKEILVQGVTKHTPVSDRKKRHAKDSKPYQTINGNLSVTVASKRTYSYLYFPDAGEGTSKTNPRNTGFMQEGADSVYNEMVNGILEAVEREM